MRELIHAWFVAANSIWNNTPRVVDQMRLKELLVVSFSAFQIAAFSGCQTLPSRRIASAPVGMTAAIESLARGSTLDRFAITQIIETEVLNGAKLASVVGTSAEMGYVSSLLRAIGPTDSALAEKLRLAEGAKSQIFAEIRATYGQMRQNAQAGIDVGNTSVSGFGIPNASDPYEEIDLEPFHAQALGGDIGSGSEDFLKRVVGKRVELVVERDGIEQTWTGQFSLRMAEDFPLQFWRKNPKTIDFKKWQKIGSHMATVDTFEFDRVKRVKLISDDAVLNSTEGKAYLAKYGRWTSLKPDEQELSRFRGKKMAFLTFSEGRPQWSEGVVDSFTNLSSFDIIDLRVKP